VRVFSLKDFCYILVLSRYFPDFIALWRAFFRSASVAFYRDALVIPPFLAGFEHRIQAANFSFWAGVIPPMAILGRSLL
jgi:hypothetical protein